MTISHKDPPMIARARAAWMNHKFLNEFIPCPQELIDTVEGFVGEDKQAELRAKQAANIKKYGYPTWYRFALGEWGTKWDVGMTQYDDPAEVTGNSFTVYFSSAWSPPTGGYAELKAMGYEICAYYYESGCDFCGRWIDGQDDCFEVSRGGIPQDIVDEMGIEEYEQ